MGCESAKEKIETQMMTLKLKSKRLKKEMIKIISLGKQSQL